MTFNILNIMTEFSTIDIYGNPQTFQYVMDFNKLDNEVSFRVFSIPANEMRWFSYRTVVAFLGESSGFRLSLPHYLDSRLYGTPVF